MSEPTPYTDDELADLPDPSLWMDAEDLLSMALRLLATVDAERARREQAEAERDALRNVVRYWHDHALSSVPPALWPMSDWTDGEWDESGWTAAEADAIRRALDASPTEGNPR